MSSAAKKNQSNYITLHHFLTTKWHEQLQKKLCTSNRKVPWWNSKLTKLRAESLRAKFEIELNWLKIVIFIRLHSQSTTKRSGKFLHKHTLEAIEKNLKNTTTPKSLQMTTYSPIFLQKSWLPGCSDLIRVELKLATGHCDVRR